VNVEAVAWANELPQGTIIHPFSEDVISAPDASELNHVAAFGALLVEAPIIDEPQPDFVE
jgi:hypothetical protein